MKGQCEAMAPKVVKRPHPLIKNRSVFDDYKKLLLVLYLNNARTYIVDSSLFDKLRVLRRSLAREEHVPPYIIFSDKTLVEMAAYMPKTREQMLAINGVGAIKYEKYGEQFLAIICASQEVESVENEKETDAMSKVVDFDMATDSSLIQESESDVSMPKKGGMNDYSYWESEFPNCVVIKKEGIYWTCRGKSAQIVCSVTGYKIGTAFGGPFVGTPQLNSVTDRLSAAKINYIVVDKCKIINQVLFA